MTLKRFLFINRKGPHGSGHPAELLDAALIAASFEQQVHLAFLDDGVFLLTRGQRPDLIGHKDFTATFGELTDYDIDHVWVERESLSARGLNENDLMIPVTLVERTALAALMADMDVVISA
ncbi:sulfurtransferase complex subunit TusC [Telmatospirillum sp.]|uniref:sulfurtransferase complex subunit TusC n=1 Tax=Telmatospirillum sp. TaxID=2079197 RepID=UPI0028408626|nr:sulfurtransferase complex subunit TusC [Telmatospirillum sp.]MDR3439055.1 sulfurtransferase complex subunit TusC [Telmatospirillum sp.]